MKKKSLNKIIRIISIVFMLLYFFSFLFSVSNASEEMLNTFKKMDNKGDNTNTASIAYTVVSAILITLQTVAVGVALIVLVVLAIKYISWSD